MDTVLRSLKGRELGVEHHGVAPYKMKADRSLTEVEWVLSIGGIEQVLMSMFPLICLGQNCNPISMPSSLDLDSVVIAI